MRQKGRAGNRQKTNSGKRFSTKAVVGCVAESPVNDRIGTTAAKPISNSPFHQKRHITVSCEGLSRSVMAATCTPLRLNALLLITARGFAPHTQTGDMNPDNGVAESTRQRKKYASGVDHHHQRIKDRLRFGTRFLGLPPSRGMAITAPRH